MWAKASLLATIALFAVVVLADVEQGASCSAHCLPSLRFLSLRFCWFIVWSLLRCGMGRREPWPSAGWKISVWRSFASLSTSIFPMLFLLPSYLIAVYSYSLRACSGPQPLFSVHDLQRLHRGVRRGFSINYSCNHSAYADILSLILATCADGVESLCSILMASVAPIVLAIPPIQATRRLASNLVRLRFTRCSLIVAHPELNRDLPEGLSE